MKKVLVAGTFDFLHPGHLALFRQAKKHGDFLVVVVARDATAHKIKGRKPFFSEGQRLDMVSEQKRVDRARLGNLGGSLWDVLLEERPEVVVLGYDQRVDESGILSFAKERGLSLEVVRAKALEPEKFKSSRVKAQLGI
ncbi:FAD synthase [Candidatus Micrarchaeota archaeon]|nr:FAD synthase [Candidatus Micrarchaeota archaeon]